VNLVKRKRQFNDVFCFKPTKPDLPSKLTRAPRKPRIQDETGGNGRGPWEIGEEKGAWRLDEGKEIAKKVKTETRIKTMED